MVKTYCKFQHQRKVLMQVYMAGGAGYVLSKQAVKEFTERNKEENMCKSGEDGPEDVEMSRCLQRLGASFIDTRDVDGR